MAESLDSQIERLANFILENVPGEPSRSEGAVDTAIRLLREVYPPITERRNVFDHSEDEPRLDGGSWKPACDTSDEEAEDVVGQPIDLPIPGEGPREL